MGGRQLAEVESKVYPGLERKPGKQNWVDKAGGLPSLIERVAKHLHYEKGRPIGVAIATAVNWAKKMCATGTAFGGKVKVKSTSQAAACKAVAQWEAKKGKSAAKSAVEGVDLSECVLTEQDELDLLTATKTHLVLVEGYLMTLRDREAGKRAKRHATANAVKLLEGKDRVDWDDSNRRFTDVADRLMDERWACQEIIGALDHPEVIEAWVTGRGAQGAAAGVSVTVPKPKRKGRGGKNARDPAFERQHPRAPKGRTTGGEFLLKSGSSGAMVKGLQRELGFSGSEISGTFDRKTRRAVRSFQKQHGLQVDGIAGTQTVSLMQDKTGVAPGRLSSSDKSFLRKQAGSSSYTRKRRKAGTLNMYEAESKAEGKSGMKKCPECGSLVKTGAKTCPHGHKLMEAKLTSKGRKQISDGDFALSGRRYPIHDESHARNALARVSQHGTPEEKKQVRSKVCSRYPKMCKSQEAAYIVHAGEQVAAYRSLREAAAEAGDSAAFTSALARERAWKARLEEASAVGGVERLVRGGLHEPGGSWQWRSRIGRWIDMPDLLPASSRFKGVSMKKDPPNAPDAERLAKAYGINVSAQRMGNLSDGPQRRSDAYDIGHWPKVLGEPPPKVKEIRRQRRRRQELDRIAEPHPAEPRAPRTPAQELAGRGRRTESVNLTNYTTAGKGTKTDPKRTVYWSAKDGKWKAISFDGRIATHQKYHSEAEARAAVGFKGGRKAAGPPDSLPDGRRAPEPPASTDQDLKRAYGIDTGFRGRRPKRTKRRRPALGDELRRAMGVDPAAAGPPPVVPRLGPARASVREDEPGDRFQRPAYSQPEFDPETAPLHEIAAVIERDWKNVNFGARPYLDAMHSLQDENSMYGADGGKSIVAYFLANANSWRGETAKKVKAALRKRQKRDGRWNERADVPGSPEQELRARVLTRANNDSEYREYRDMSLKPVEGPIGMEARRAALRLLDKRMSEIIEEEEARMGGGRRNDFLYDVGASIRHAFGEGGLEGDSNTELRSIANNSKHPLRNEAKRILRDRGESIRQPAIDPERYLQGERERVARTTPAGREQMRRLANNVIANVDRKGGRSKPHIEGQYARAQATLRALDEYEAAPPDTLPPGRQVRIDGISAEEQQRLFQRAQLDRLRGPTTRPSIRQRQREEGRVRRGVDEPRLGGGSIEEKVANVSRMSTAALQQLVRNPNADPRLRDAARKELRDRGSSERPLARAA